MDCKELILSNDVRDILVDYSFETGEIRLDQNAYCYLALDRDLGVLYVPAAYEEQLQSSQYRYLYTPKCYSLTQLDRIDLSFEMSGIYRMQDRPFNLTGKQVLIGFVDTGIRYSHPIFQNSDGSSRIYAIWDQTDQTGVSPEGFHYGSEYRQKDGALLRLQRQEEEREVLGDESANMDPSGHGTAVASIAVQAALDAQIVMVKCKTAKSYLKEEYGISESAEVYAESDILNGLVYLERMSLITQRPLVICFTMGTNMGNHKSDSVLDQYLATLGKKRGHCVIVSGGNEGNRAHHYEGILGEADAKEYEDVEIRVSEGVTGFSYELWGNSPGVYTISLRSPDGELLERIPARQGQRQRHSFVYSDTVATVEYVSSERNSAQQLIFVRLESPLAGIWTMRVYCQEAVGLSEFHVWLPMEEMLGQPVYFLKPDPLWTMTEPAYTEDVIGLSYYNASNGSFAIDSGRGAGMINVITPTICAPGIQIQTAAGIRSGGSMSAALTAGTAAQLLEWAVVRKQNPLINSRGVRNYYIWGAIRDQNMEYPNPSWGYGRLSIEGIFQTLASFR